MIKNAFDYPVEQRLEQHLQDLVLSDRVLNVNEAASLLRVHPVTLRKRAVKWGIPHKRLGSEWRFSKKMLMDWLQSQGSN